MWLPAGMVAWLLVLVLPLLVVPLQPPTVQPELGAALSWSCAPATYRPAEQLGEADGETPGFAPEPEWVVESR